MNLQEQLHSDVWGGHPGDCGRLGLLPGLEIFGPAVRHALQHAEELGHRQ